MHHTLILRTDRYLDVSRGQRLIHSLELLHGRDTVLYVPFIWDTVLHLAFICYPVNLDVQKWRRNSSLDKVLTMNIKHLDVLLIQQDQNVLKVEFIYSFLYVNVLSRKLSGWSQLLTRFECVPLLTFRGHFAVKYLIGYV